MAFPLVPAVEPLGIDAVEAVAAVGELVAQGFDDEVVVVRHQAEGVNEPVVALHHVCEEPQEEPAVVVAAENRRPVDPTRADVERAVGEDLSRQSATHVVTVRATKPPTPTGQTRLLTKRDTLVAVAMTVCGSSSGQSTAKCRPHLVANGG